MEMTGFLRKEKKQTADDLIREIQNGANISLTGLDRIDFSKLPRRKKTDKEKWEDNVATYLTREERYWRHINGCIYSGSEPCATEWYHKPYDIVLSDWKKRMHFLYGSQYEKLRHHVSHDPVVKELLMQDAIRTGKWKELPRMLWIEYHERMGAEPWKAIK